MKNERYYYSIMKPAEKAAYKMIYAGLIKRDYQIPVTGIYDYGDVQVIYLKVLFDNPLLYYVNQLAIKGMGEPHNYVLLPEYLYSQAEIYELNIKLKETVDFICSHARNFNSQFRMEKYLHDSMVKSVAYDYDALVKQDCFDAHSIVGALLHKRAVCEGIAKAFKLLCNELDIKCIVVVGKANQEGDFSGESFHAWNLVKIEEESYYVDVTWDNSYDEGFRHISYDYFNVTTEQIKVDHIPDDDMPLCTSNRYNYFYCSGSLVSTYQELKAFIEERLNNESIIFKVRQPSGELGTPQAFKDAVCRAMQEITIKRKGNVRLCRMAFLDLLLIGKIYFR